MRLPAATAVRVKSYRRQIKPLFISKAFAKQPRPDSGFPRGLNALTKFWNLRFGLSYSTAPLSTLPHSLKMAKAVTQKPTKVAKPKKSLLSSVAESSKKANAKPAIATKPVVVEKPASKAAGKRKLNEEESVSEATKKSKKATVKPDEVEDTGMVAETDEKPKAKGKKKAQPVGLSHDEWNVDEPHHWEWVD